MLMLPVTYILVLKKYAKYFNLLLSLKHDVC